MVSHYPVFFSLKSYCYLTQTCGNKIAHWHHRFYSIQWTSSLLCTYLRRADWSCPLYHHIETAVPVTRFPRHAFHCFANSRPDDQNNAFIQTKQHLRRTFLWYYFSDTVHNLISLFLLQHFSHARYWRQKKTQMRCSQRHISISIHKTNKSSSTSSQTSGSIITVKILTSLMSSIR